MRRLRIQPVLHLFWLCLALACAGHVTGLSAQTANTNKSTVIPPAKELKEPKNSKKEEGTGYHRAGFQQMIYYEPPSTQVKMELSGTDVTNVPSGLLVTESKIKTFATTGGEPQLIAETPQCVFNTDSSQISSSNIFRAHSGDGNFYVEGVGFLWQQTSPDLTLSNQVHTIIRQTNSAKSNVGKTNTPVTETHIHSESATFDEKAGLAIYREQVRLENSQLNLTSAILTAKFLQGEATNQLDHVTAETNVVMDFTDEIGRKTHATSDKAVYTRTTGPVTNELLELSGNPKLETTNGWMTADVFLMDRTADTIRGAGNYHFHSRMNLEPGGTNSGKATAPSETEIFSDQFEFDNKTGLAVYRSHVRVNNPQMKLACETMTATLPQGESRTSGIDKIVAETNVVMDYFDEHGEKTRATGRKAVYEVTVVAGRTNKTLELTGNPVLERTNGWIMADLILIDRVNGIIIGEGNHHSLYKPKPGEVGKDGRPKSADTEIFSDQFDFDNVTGLAHYRGNVRVLDPEKQLQCRTMTAQTGQVNGTNRIQNVVAETNVVIDFISNKGEKNHATGDKAVYALTPAGGTNEVMTLFGHPKVEMPNRWLTADDAIIYDKTTGKYRALSSNGVVHAFIKLGAAGKTNTITNTNTNKITNNLPALPATPAK